MGARRACLPARRHRSTALGVNTDSGQPQGSFRKIPRSFPSSTVRHTPARSRFLSPEIVVAFIHARDCQLIVQNRS
jgi:hypothetical protein